MFSTDPYRTVMGRDPNSRKLIVWAVVGGAVLTVGVAWWSAFYEDCFGGTACNIVTTLSGPAWQGALVANGAMANGVLSFAIEADQTKVRVAQSVVEGPAWSRIRIKPTREQVDSCHALFEDARGWPLPALMALHSSDTTFAVWETNWGFSVAGSQWHYRVPRALPLRPIIGGFLVDWTVFAVVSYLVLYRISHARRNARLRHKRCVTCGYPRGTAAVCSECGADVQDPISETL